jgi:dTDP-glucose 4,6-dehydratase
VEGLIRLMESELAEPCNLGNPVERTMLELASHINRVTDNSAGLVFGPLPTDDPTRRQPDIGRAREALGWTPKVAFEDGLHQTIRWFCDHPER